jgi:LysR family transcriptional regulator, low CO2-responsive transcriptional regulator
VHEAAVRAQLDSGELTSYSVPGTPLDRPWQLCTTSEPTAATRLFLTHVCDVGRVGAAAFHTRHRPQG